MKPKGTTPAAQRAACIARFTPDIAARARAVLMGMRARLPGAVELVYDNYNGWAIGFGPSERASEAPFSIVLYPLGHPVLPERCPAARSPAHPPGLRQHSAPSRPGRAWHRISGEHSKTVHQREPGAIQMPIRHRKRYAILLFAASNVLQSPIYAPAPTARRHDIPVPGAIRAAYTSGTRDSSGLPGPNYWQLRTAEYSIEAHLDTATSIISGRETIRVFNTSPLALATLQMRLDHNLFRAGALSDVELPSHTDGMIVTRLIIDGRGASIGGPDRKQTGGWLSGTTGTSERINLGKPLMAGASLRIDVEWRTEIPLDAKGSGVRTGRWGTRVYQVGQWYPRIAMFDDLLGWDTSPYHGENEFFNPYGRFDVRLDIPAGWLIGATGVLQNAEDILTAGVRARLAHVPDSDSTIAIVNSNDWGPGKATLNGDRLI